MRVQELIEKHADHHAHSNDLFFARAHLKHFAIELLELVRQDFGNCDDLTGGYIDKALEELRK